MAAERDSTTRLLRKPYAEAKPVREAILMHLFHGFALGVLFAILAGFILPLSFWTLTTAGVAYSFVLWLIIPFSFRRVFENAGRTRFTRDGMMVALTAHLIYGIVLGAVLSVIQ